MRKKVDGKGTKLEEGGDSFEVLHPHALTQKETLSEKDKRELGHAIGVRDTGFHIPGTEVNKNKGEDIYELPIYGSPEGSIRKVIGVNKKGETPRVYKIERSLYTYTNEREVRKAEKVHEKINELLPENSAKSMGGIWIENIEFPEKIESLFGKSKGKLYIPIQELVDQKNFAETSFVGEKGERKIRNVSKKVGKIVGKLFENNIMLDDLKPQDFCPGKEDQPVLVDEQNAHFRTKYRKAKTKKVGNGLAKFVEDLKQFNPNLFYEKQEKGRKLNKKLVKDVGKAIKKGVNKEVSSRKEKGYIMKEFDNRFARMLREGEKGLPEFHEETEREI